jgi:hypothetical protein
MGSILFWTREQNGVFEKRIEDVTEKCINARNKEFHDF